VFDRQASGSHDIRRYTTIPSQTGDWPEGTLQLFVISALYRSYHASRKFVRNSQERSFQKRRLSRAIHH
jgi:hypothetical protein